MRDSRKHSKKGMTYMEIVISIMVTSLMILPLCHTFLEANKMRIKANRLQEAISYGEIVLQAVENQLDKSITKQVNKELDVPDYLTKKPEDCPDYTLAAFLGEDETNAAFIEKYATDQFAYQVVMWNITKGIPVTTGTWDSFDDVDEAIKICSDGSYLINNDFVTGLDEIDKIEWEQKGTDVDLLKDYSSKENGFWEITLEKESGRIKPKVKSKIENGYIITENAALDETTYTIDGTGDLGATILIDAREIKTEDITSLSSLYLSFNNLTGKPISIKLISSVDEGELSKVFFVALGDNMLLERIGEEELAALLTPYTYSIVVVVTDKKPIIGKPLIKKWISVYTYLG